MSARSHLSALLAGCFVLAACGGGGNDQGAAAVGGMAGTGAAAGTGVAGASPMGGAMAGANPVGGVGSPVGGEWAAGSGGAGGASAGTVPPPPVTGGTGVSGAGGTGVSGTGASGTGGAGGTTATGGSGGAGGTMTSGGAGGAAGTMMTGGAGGTGGTGATVGCTPAPSGTFQTVSEMGGPGGGYYIYRPTTLGEGGFLHPPVAWGNGLATTPPTYDATLSKVAAQGFVVIANPGTGSDPMVVRQGLEWLLDQNTSGQYAGKLAVDCAATIGYSMGGGAAVGAGAHPAVKAVVSIHGLQDASEDASGPILLLTSDGDLFVTKDGFVQPCFDRSTVQPTLMATHVAQPQAPVFGDHLEPLGGGVMDTDPMIAWLRFWLYGDETQRDWFFGPGCTLCGGQWTDIQQKNYDFGR